MIFINSYRFGVSSYTQDFLSITGSLGTTIDAALVALEASLTSAGLINYSNPSANKIKILYPFAGGDATKHSYNFLNPALYQLTFSGTWVHDANGVTSDGLTAYAGGGFLPFANLSFGDNHLSFYSRTQAVGLYDLGSTEQITGASINEFILIARYTGDLAFFSADGAYNCAVANADGRGFFQGGQQGGSTQRLYRNGAEITNAVSGGSQISNRQIVLGGVLDDFAVEYFTARNYAMMSAGLGLTAGESANYYTAVQTFQTSLSRNV